MLMIVPNLLVEKAKPVMTNRRNRDFMISKIISVAIASFLVSFNSGFTQELHKHFEVKESAHTEKLSLTVSTKAGNSYLNGVNADKHLEIWGGNEKDMAASTFKIQNFKNIKKVDANLTCKDHVGVNFTEALARNIFTDNNASNDIWQLNLSENVSFDLDLHYLIGSAKIDLSRLSIENLRINSGSADVHVNYSDGEMNSVAMDTFFVKVNLGKITIDNLDLAMADEIIAEVGFGSIALDCGTKWKMNSKVTASVGAGSMTILLPPVNKAVLIKINDSALCHIKLSKNFDKIGHNVYANAAYQKEHSKYLEFSLDVGMGSISFIDR